jgi:hypothetical protein
MEKGSVGLEEDGAGHFGSVSLGKRRKLGKQPTRFKSIFSQRFLKSLLNF